MLDINKKLDIVVVGGSLAGLMTSIPLKRLGHKVTILERSSTPLLHDQGAGVVAGGETQAFFRKHDLTQRDIAVTSGARLYLDKAGNVIDREDYQQRMTSWDLLYYLGRANFDSVKSAYVDASKLSTDADGSGNAKYDFGRSVTSVQELGDKVEIKYENTRPDGNEPSVGSGSIVADLVIAADGPRPIYGNNSWVQIPRTEAMPDMLHFEGRFQKLSYRKILAYTNPGSNGSLDTGSRLVNWVWYWNVEESSEEYASFMTDSDGNRHRWTLPTGGKMQSKVWELQKERANEVLPPQFAELVSKTTMPFVQAITDVEPPQHGTQVGRLLNGKALVVGDAVSGFRPHTAASTSQAAYHALMLERVFKGELDLEEYEKQILDFAWSWQQRGVMLGTRSQFGHHPLASPGEKDEVDRSELHMRPGGAKH